MDNWRGTMPAPSRREVLSDALTQVPVPPVVSGDYHPSTLRSAMKCACIRKEGMMEWGCIV
jgi:hypothetical protein